MTFRNALEDLGYRVAEERRRVGLTQAAFAERVGIEVRVLQYIEGGKQATTLQTLYDLAVALDVDLMTLFRPPRQRPRRKPGRPRSSSKGRRSP